MATNRRPSAVVDHPLGYRGRVLFDVFGWRIRLHVWHGEASAAPHNHRWGFVGLPVRGWFREIRWREVRGDDYEVVRTHPPDGADDRRVTPTGRRSGLVAVRRHMRGPWRPYLCRYGEIHTYLSAGSGPHVSLVLLGRARSDNSEIWQEIS
jgi:hypothetical protein